jgi:hypothetical protein
MGKDLINPFLFRQGAYKLLAFFLISRALTSIAIIIEESLSQQKPSSDKPHKIEDHKRSELICAFTINLVEQTFERSE